MRRCTGTRRDGQQCTVTAIPGEEYCMRHRPKDRPPISSQEVSRLRAAEKRSAEREVRHCRQCGRPVYSKLMSFCFTTCANRYRARKDAGE